MTLVNSVAVRLKAAGMPSTVYEPLITISVKPTKEMPVDCKLPVKAYTISTLSIGGGYPRQVKTRNVMETSNPTDKSENVIGRAKPLGLFLRVFIPS